MNHQPVQAVEEWCQTSNDQSTLDILQDPLYIITPDDLGYNEFSVGTMDAGLKATSIRVPLFALTILSGKKEAIKWAEKYINDHVEDKTAVSYDMYVEHARCVGSQYIM